MVKTCPDCGAPVGEDFLPLYGCWLYGQLEESYRRQGRERDIKELAGGGDPPCIHHHYVYGQEQLSRRRRRVWLPIWGAVALACALLWWWL